MADTTTDNKIKLVDYEALKIYDKKIKEWFKAQLVYATEDDVLALFSSNSRSTDTTTDTKSNNQF